MTPAEEIEILQLKRKRAMAMAQQEAPEEIGSPLFPTASKIEGSGIVPSAKRVGTGLLDALNIPTRALATVSGQKMSDPNSYLLRPAVDAMKADTTGEREKEFQILANKGNEGYPDFSWQTMPSAVNANLETAGRMASDPLALKSLLNTSARPIQGLGEKIYTTALKPSKSLTFGQGLKPAAILDAGYGGNFENNLESIAADKSSLVDQIEAAAKAKALNNPAATVDLTKALHTTKQDLASAMLGAGDEPMFAGQHAEVNRGLGEWANDLANRPLGVTDPWTAIKYQRGVGAMGEFDKRIPIAEIPPKSIVANDFYRNIGDELQGVVPEIAPMRQEVNKMIPMQQAIAEAAARTKKNNMFGLMGSIFAAGSGGNLKKAAMIGLNAAQKSPTVGNALYQSGKALSDTDPIREAITRALLSRDIIPQDSE